MNGLRVQTVFALHPGITPSEIESGVWGFKTQLFQIINMYMYIYIYSLDFGCSARKKQETPDIRPVQNKLVWEDDHVTWSMIYHCQDWP